MSQINRYKVQRVLTGGSEQELSSKDEALITSYSLGNSTFLTDKYQLNGTFYTPDGLFLETEEDLKTYSILGTNQGEAVTEISVDPVQDALNLGYLGDVQVEYTVTNNLFSPSHSLDLEAVLFIREISTDRTEIRATSTTLTESQMQGFAQDLYRKLNLEAYFNGVTLRFVDTEDTTAWCINVMTEVLDGSLVVTFKTYEPLPDTVDIKSRFTVLEQIGEPVRFEVIRTVEVTEDTDSTPKLKGPNFDVETRSTELGTVTDYLNFQELFSYPEVNRKSDLYSIYKEQGIELSIDHSDFSNFIHFSSAAERLENFRYKLGLIQGYEQELEVAELEAEKIRLRDLVQGIIDNFDHYDRYLYFQNTETAWPKVSANKPYVNVPVEEAKEWFEQQLRRAQEYDESNPDILINTVPQAIRSDSRNEPYLVFIHMIGQHFDEEWVYAKAVSDRYSGDNRLDFGISKDLVREALKSFGVELETTNQNLEKLFELCVPGEMYNTGSEASVTEFRRITTNVDGHPESLPIVQVDWDGEYAHWLEENPDGTLDGFYAYWNTLVNQTADGGGALTAQGSLQRSEFQPIFVDDYRKEIYKRIYHNIPLLLKTKGTTRGLRALISCFGIPEDLLEISVAGGANIEQSGSFFGPEYRTTFSQDRVRIDNGVDKAALMFDETLGTFISGTVLSLDRQINQPGQKYQAGTNNVEVGFRLNGQFDREVKDLLTSTSVDFDYDNLIGDPRNTEENYGEAFILLRDQILPELRGDQKELPIRTPTAILRLIRYYDSALFRTLQSFVPARDVVSTGAIIDDNILHRNRYRGVVPESNLGSKFTGKWTKTGSTEDRWSDQLTASIETVFIDGGEAGCLKVLCGGRPGGKAPQTQSFVIRATINSAVTESRECPSVNYSESLGQSIGSEYVDKIVFDDSPRFNGELSGTDYEVTNGELNEGNKFKRGGSSSKYLDYTLDYRFLCLPRFPIDTTLRALGTTNGLEFPIDLRLTDQSENAAVFVGSKEATEPVVVDETVSETTRFEIKSAKGYQGGWLYSSGSGVPKKYINYIGIDGSEFGERHIASELRRLGSVTVPTFLLPVVEVESSFQTELMRANLNLKFGEGSESVSLWNNILDYNRRVYPRMFRKDTDFSGSRSGFSLKILDNPEWKPLGSGQETLTLTEAVNRGLVQVTNLKEQKPDNLISLVGSLKRIYVQTAFDSYVVIDLDRNIVAQYTVPDNDNSKFNEWYYLKGYHTEEGTDPWDGDPHRSVKDYLSTRYRGHKSRTIGVVVEDTDTGLEYFGSKLTLMEQYMGCSWVFASGSSGEYQLCIEDWI